jgi:hypothetical protein
LEKPDIGLPRSALQSSTIMPLSRRGERKEKKVQIVVWWLYDAVVVENGQ